MLAKVSNVYAPLFFKDAIDALENKPELAIAAPLGIIFAYGLVRIGATLFGEIREALFAAVAQGAIRGVGLDVFRHLHNLSLRFHLERRTGGLSRAIERGVKAIETLLRFAVFSVLPTIFEIIVVLAILVEHAGLAVCSRHRRHNRHLRDVHKVCHDLAPWYPADDERGR